MPSLQSQTQYVDFVVSIKQRILKSQYEALKSVNKELIALYWDIGKSIVEKQNEFAWGKSVVKTLAQDLQKEFIGIKGFSVQNLWNMRLFILNIIKIQNSNHWLEKLVGLKILSFLPTSEEIAERLRLFDDSEKIDDN